MRRKRRLVITLLAGLVLGGLPGCRSTARRAALPPGNGIVSPERQRAWTDDSAYAREVLQYWATQPFGDWRKRGKIEVPRTILARLRTGTLLPETNAYLLGLRPWGETGSTWTLHPQGDYDFTLTVLSTILWQYGDDETRLSPAARKHLLDVLLTEEGNAFRDTVPRSLGLVRDTENHLLMTEGSRYLKNRWLHVHGDPRPRFDNATNGMETKLLALLDELKTAGLYEFNSQPYVAYTLTALLNLEAFASDPVRASARALIDQMNRDYALGSYQLRHFPPFRRRYEHAADTSLNAGYQTVFMKAWLSLDPTQPTAPQFQKYGASHALMAISLPYRPPDEVVRLLSDKGDGYFARLGHGPDSSPEIYSAGKKFLLSGGGVNRGENSQVVARPITLLLDDHATELSEVFHLAGPRTDFRGWNNTGVYKQFACAAGPVHVPANFKALQTNGAWKLYAPSSGVWVVTYSAADLGLLVVLEQVPAGQWFAEIVQANPDVAKLTHSFTYPNGRKLDYDLRSAKNRWVMAATEGEVLDREIDLWSLLQLERR